MFRKTLTAVIVLTITLASAAPTAAAPARQEASFGDFFWSLVERFVPAFGRGPQKSDTGPAIDPNTPSGLVVSEKGPAIDPNLQGGGGGNDVGSSVDPDGGG